MEAIQPYQGNYSRLHDITGAQVPEVFGELFALEVFGYLTFLGYLKCLGNSLRWKECPQRKVKAELALLCRLEVLSACSWRLSFRGLSLVRSANVVSRLNGAVLKEWVCIPMST